MTNISSLEGFLFFGAGEEIRTLDIHLGKVALYQLSYSRVELKCTDFEANLATRGWNCLLEGLLILHLER